MIDSDTVESTNLNRLAGASPADVGRNKTEVARQHVLRVAPLAEVEENVGDVMRTAVARRLADLDIIFGCTDSHGSRAVLQQISYQYLVPCIDMGAAIVASNGRISHVYGRVQLLAPGLPCFTCSDLLDPNQVRRDMMTPLERRTDPYIVGAAEPAPAVMSLNGTVASLAVTMLLSVTTKFPGDARHLLYNAIASSLRTVAGRPRPDCFICSRAGVLGRGDSTPIMARQD
jgi:molybdopterin/thiamine biosynthesis adenylyltransferase